MLATVTQPTREEELEPVEGEAAEGEAPRRGRGRPKARRPPRPATSPSRPRSSTVRLWPRRHGTSLRPARRRARQPGPRVRPQPPQRRLARRRRARPPPRRLVAGEVQRPARRGAHRRAPGRAAEARDVHERLGALGAGGDAVLQARAETRCSSSTTRAISKRGASRLGSAAGPPATTASARSRPTSARRLPAPARRRGAPRARRPAAARRLGPLRLRAADEDAGPPRPGAADAVEVLDAEGLEAAQRAVNPKRS